MFPWTVSTTGPKCPDTHRSPVPSPQLYFPCIKFILTLALPTLGKDSLQLFLQLCNTTRKKEK